MQAVLQAKLHSCKTTFTVMLAHSSTCRVRKNVPLCPEQEQPCLGRAQLKEYMYCHASVLFNVQSAQKCSALLIARAAMAALISFQEAPPAHARTSTQVKRWNFIAIKHKHIISFISAASSIILVFVTARPSGEPQHLRLTHFCTAAPDTGRQSRRGPRTSKMSVAFGGMRPRPAPRAPYASSAGMTSVRLPPSCPQHGACQNNRACPAS